MLRSVVIFASLTLATIGGLLFGCEGHESFQLGDDGGSIVRTREVRLATDWDRRPEWFASDGRASASARA